MEILIDAAKCTGCTDCELICYFARTQVFNPKKSRIKVVPLDYLGFSNPVLCLLCTKPRCVAVCPTGALVQTSVGTIDLKEQDCTGCRICVEECIVGAINFDEDTGLPLICDLCGGKPACVEWCPAGALTIKGSKNNQAAGGSRNRRENRQLKKQMAFTITKARPLLRKWSVPDNSVDWYAQFI